MVLPNVLSQIVRFPSYKHIIAILYFLDINVDIKIYIMNKTKLVNPFNFGLWFYEYRIQLDRVFSSTIVFISSACYFYSYYNIYLHILLYFYPIGQYYGPKEI